MLGKGICQEEKEKFAQKPLNSSEALAVVSCAWIPSRAVTMTQRKEADDW